MDERLQIFQDKMEKSLANLNEEFAGIRAGRANPHVLDKLRVDYYGTPSPIQSVANVSVPVPSFVGLIPRSELRMAFSISFTIDASHG